MQAAARLSIEHVRACVVALSEELRTKAQGGLDIGLPSADQTLSD